MARSYWDYYRQDYEWNDQEPILIDKSKSAEAFSHAGFSDDQVEDLIKSGYVVVRGVVIDRYYGGMLSSVDLRSRFTLDEFAKGPFFKSHPATVHRATGIQDVVVISDN